VQISNIKINVFVIILQMSLEHNYLCSKYLDVDYLYHAHLQYSLRSNTIVGGCFDGATTDLICRLDKLETASLDIDIYSLDILSLMNDLTDFDYYGESFSS